MHHKWRDGADIKTKPAKTIITQIHPIPILSFDALFTSHVHHTTQTRTNTNTPAATSATTANASYCYCGHSIAKLVQTTTTTNTATYATATIVKVTKGITINMICGITVPCCVPEYVSKVCCDIRVPVF